MVKRFAVPVLFFALAACGASQEAPEAASPAAEAPMESALSVENARVRPPAGGQTIAAGFLTLRGGAAADRLVGASSPAADSIELHTMREEGGMMQMAKVDGYDVPPGGALELAPHGNHLMLFGYKAAADATAIPLTLTFEKAGEVSTMLTVDAVAPAEQGKGH